jgi:hypothetical protein
MDLGVQFAGHLLVGSQWRGRFLDIRDAIDQLFASVIVPSQVFAKGVLLCVAQRECHTRSFE